LGPPFSLGLLGNLEISDDDRGYFPRLKVLRVIITLLICSLMQSLARDPIFLLHDVARIMRTRFDQWAKAYGMTRAQGVILVRLERQPGLSQNEMAAICEVEPITVGRLVDRLETRGLIERRPDPTDRRVRRLHLLPAATPVLADIHAYKAELTEFVAKGLDPKAVEILVDVLLHMKTKLTTEAANDKLAAAGE
jgi:MarR family transcriptional regulator for hemolysin